MKKNKLQPYAHMIGCTYAGAAGDVYRVTAIIKHSKARQKQLILKDGATQLHVLADAVNGTDQFAATMGWPVTLFTQNFKKVQR